MKIKFIESNHYQRFSYFSSNRNLDENHVKRLMYSIELNGLLEEITINEKWQIIDGQHRFEALKRLSLPVYAKIKSGASEDDIMAINPMPLTMIPEPLIVVLENDAWLGG